MHDEEQGNFLNFEVTFTDSTVLQANGEYEATKKIMEQPVRVVGKIFAEPPSKEWVVNTTISIRHDLGYAQVSCDLYHNGRVIVVSYVSTSKDLHRTDIRCLSHWAQNAGWNIPEPHPGLVDADKDFWRLQWETYIVNSEYMTNKMGTRTGSFN